MPDSFIALGQESPSACALDRKTFIHSSYSRLNWKLYDKSADKKS